AGHGGGRCPRSTGTRTAPESCRGGGQGAVCRCERHNRHRAYRIGASSDAEHAEALQASAAGLQDKIRAVSAALQASDVERASQRASVEATLAAHEMRHAELAGAMDALNAGNAEHLRNHRE